MSAVFAQATAADEADVRRLLRATSTAGALRVGFAREPDYFAGEGLAGGDDHTIIVRRDGRLVCMGRCSMRTVYLNGEPRWAGYLGELRMAADAGRPLEILRKGYRFFHDVALSPSRKPTDFYFTSIAADNDRGRRVLEGGRRLGLPEYRFLTELVTRVAPVSRRGTEAGRESEDGRASREELSAFLEQHSRAGQLGLTWDDARWSALARHGVGAEDFVCIRRAGEIVAAGAVWDQRAFKQTIIHGYGTALRWARPWINGVGACFGRPGLPAPGEVLPQAALLGTIWTDEAALAGLWPRLQRRAAVNGVRWLTLTTDTHDDRTAHVSRVLGGREYRTRLYAVSWPDLPTQVWVSDGRPFRPEVGLL
jgi:hypothetical protein